MSVSNHQLVPGFRSLDEDITLNYPLSGWAVLSLVVGLACLLVPVSLSLIPLSLIAIVLGLVVSIRLTRQGTHAGLWMANLCLGLGLATAVWCLVAHKTRNDYLTQEASRFAAEYLELVSAGKLYNAIELRLPFSDRQPVGVDLQALYEMYQGEVNPELAMLSLIGSDDEDGTPPDPARTRKLALERLKRDPVTLYCAQFPEARWIFAETKAITSKGDMSTVKLAMKNGLDERNQVVIEMMRNRDRSDSDDGFAEWRVNNLELEKL